MNEMYPEEILATVAPAAEKPAPGAFVDSETNEPYFCFKRTGNIFVSDSLAVRFYMTRRLTPRQLAQLHAKELQLAHPMSGAQISEMFYLPRVGKVNGNQLAAIKDWLTWNLVDGVDHRCPEIPEDVAAQHPEMAKYPHMVRELGGLHEADSKITQGLKMPDADEPVVTRSLHITGSLFDPSDDQ